MEYFKIQSFWSDDCTFPDSLDSGIVVRVRDIEEAVKEAFKNIKPQVKPYIDTEIHDSENATLSYYPTPSKNKNGYTELIEITESTEAEYESQSWVKADSTDQNLTDQTQIKKYLVGSLFGRLEEKRLTESERLHYLSKGFLVIPLDK